MVRQKTHQEYATSFFRSYTTFELNSGHQSLAYDSSTNRITSAGFSYDAAGNQLQNNTGQSLIYDAAGRLAKVKDQNQSNATIATYTYGASKQRLITQTGDESSTAKTYYIWDGGAVVAEYTEQTSANMPKWSKNYVYFGGRLLATEEPNGSGEKVHYHHPDRLGTRLVTNNIDSTYFEQVSLPFGTSLDAESTGATNRRFTSYDRSAATGLDYAVNRHYDPKQGRFTQPDPLGMGAASLADPQSFNMYSYVGNDPMNRVDPDGQFWGALAQFVVGLFHSFKPNIINGSFAYHNHPPISVSFTTDRQNIGFGYAGIEIPLRSGGLWLPELLVPQNSSMPCSPTGTELKGNDTVRKELEQALIDSLPDDMQNMHEENGYIFVDQYNKVTIIRGEPGRPISKGPLNSPNSNFESTPFVLGSWFVGMFHTHPAREGLQDPTSPPGYRYTDPSKPSPGDPVAARKMGVPDLIAYRGKNGKLGITVVGPKRALWTDNRGCRK